MKYFLVQVCGSLTLLIAGILIGYQTLPWQGLIGLAILLKLGAAPLHFWYPQLSEEVEWPSFLILRTIQKVAPLTLLFYSRTELFFLLYLSTGARAITGGLGGVNELLIRKLLAYSSINHLGWILLTFTLNSLLWVAYFFVYALVLRLLVKLLNRLQIFHFSQLKLAPVSSRRQIRATLGLFSLGGFPFLFGFLPKWIILQFASPILRASLLGVLVIISTLTLFFYRRLTLGLLLTRLSKKTSPLQPLDLLTFNSGLNLLGFWMGRGIIHRFAQ